MKKEKKTVESFQLCMRLFSWISEVLKCLISLIDMSRIDDNMDESLANVEGARSSLLRYLNQISSNRWLMIKIFAILIFFLIFFIFFVA